MRREKGFRDILGKEETKMINSKISKIIYIIILLMVVMLIIPNNISKAFVIFPGDYTMDINLDWVQINCNDENFYNCVKSLFSEEDLVADDINYDLIVLKESIEKITEINFRSEGIKDITGIEQFTSLTRLWLYNNQIRDISALKDMTSLTRLALYTNQISNISALKDMTSLTYLYLDNNQIRDISALKDMTSLTRLDLDCAEITNWGFEESKIPDTCKVYDGNTYKCTWGELKAAYYAEKGETVPEEQDGPEKILEDGTLQITLRNGEIYKKEEGINYDGGNITIKGNGTLEVPYIHSNKGSITIKENVKLIVNGNFR